MKKVIYHLCVISLGILLMYSCSKDFDLPEAGKKPTQTNLELRTDDYDLSSYSEADQALINLAKVVNYYWHHSPGFKSDLLSRLFDDIGRTEYLFVDGLDLPAIPDENLIVKTGLSVPAYQMVIDHIYSDCNNLVLKVPRWAEVLWLSNQEESLEFSHDLISNLDYVFYPRLSILPEDNTWRGYRYDQSGNEEYLGLHKDAYPEGHLPIMVRHSDVHAFMNPNDFTGKNGTVLVNQKYDMIPLSSPCHPSNVIQNHIVKDCGEYVLVHYINFMDEVSHKCDEICGNLIDDDFDGLVDESCATTFGNNIEICDNGIDDDGDGEADCKDLDCCFSNPYLCECIEICGNGLDEDLDGLTDEEDPDCCRYYADCFRDCRLDANFVESVKLVDNSMISQLSGAPSYDDAISIRMLFFEFIQSSSVVNEKQIPGFLFGFCQTTTLGDFCEGEPNYFYSLKLITNSPPPPGSFILGAIEYGENATFWVVVNGPVDRVNKVQWLGEWNGGITGERVRCKVIASNLEVVNTNIQQSVQVTEQTSNTIGYQSGGGGGTNSQGQNQGSGGWSFNDQNGTTVNYTSSVQYMINNQGEEDLGTVDFGYCDHEFYENLMALNMMICNEFEANDNCGVNYYSGPAWNDYDALLVHGGKILSTGSIELKTSIEIDWP